MKTLLTTALLLASTSVMAAGPYVGIGSTGTAFDDDYGDAAVASLSLKAGYAFTDNIALEARIAGESDWDSYAYNVDVRVDKSTAVYARLSLGNETFDPYILVGFADIEATARETYWGYQETVSDSGAAFGFGANWKIGEHFAITGDWTIPVEDVVQFNLSADFRF